MPFLRFFSRHSRFTAQADAYADGELRGKALERFEAHVSACRRCGDAVASGRELRAALQQLPEAPTPRSFRITPAMVAASPSAPARAATPFYLGLARSAAALAVVAFGTAFAVTALDDSGGANDQAAGADLRETFESADALATSAPKDEAGYEAVPRTPEIAPATTGGASGSGVENPVTPTDSTTDRASSAPPETGEAAVVPMSGTDDDGGLPAAGIEAADTAFAEDEDGISGAVIALGVVALVAVTLLAGLEVNRRLRRT